MIISCIVLMLLVPLWFLALRPTEARADQTYKPYRGVAWNGKKIYLSPARHNDAGSRGECGAADENKMAFDHAWDATNAPNYQDVYRPNSPLRNLRAMGYKVRIGTNTLQSAIRNSNRWGATRHIPLHSNAHAHNNCGNTNAGQFGTVGIYWSSSGTGSDLANKIKNRIGAWTGTAEGNVSPGTNDYICYNPGHPCTNISLAELRDTAAPAAYIESEFHTWNRGYSWLRDSFHWAWRTAWGIDDHLGNPR